MLGKLPPSYLTGQPSPKQKMKEAQPQPRRMNLMDFSFGGWNDVIDRVQGALFFFFIEFLISTPLSIRVCWLCDVWQHTRGEAAMLLAAGMCVCGSRYKKKRTMDDDGKQTEWTRMGARVAHRCLLENGRGRRERSRPRERQSERVRTSLV